MAQLNYLKIKSCLIEQYSFCIQGVFAFTLAQQRDRFLAAQFLGSN